jgi:hypothetical protein
VTLFQRLVVFGLSSVVGAAHAGVFFLLATLLGFEPSAAVTLAVAYVVTMAANADVTQEIKRR